MQNLITGQGTDAVDAPTATVEEIGSDARVTSDEDAVGAADEGTLEQAASVAFGHGGCDASKMVTDTRISPVSQNLLAFDRALALQGCESEARPNNRGWQPTRSAYSHNPRCISSQPLTRSAAGA